MLDTKNPCVDLMEHPHFTDRQTAAEKSSNLLNVPELTGGRVKLRTVVLMSWSCYISAIFALEFHDVDLILLSDVKYANVDATDDIRSGISCACRQ